MWRFSHVTYPSSVYVPHIFVSVLNRQVTQTYRHRWEITVKDLTELIPVRHNMSQELENATCVSIQEIFISTNWRSILRKKNNKYHTVVTSLQRQKFYQSHYFPSYPSLVLYLPIPMWGHHVTLTWSETCG